MIEPSDFEDIFINQVRSHLEQCGRLKIQLQISRPILDRIMERYPWDRMADPKWKGWILDWQAAVLSELDKRTVNHETQINGVDGDTPLKADDLWDVWCAFLNWWENGIVLGGKYSKGIGAHDCHAVCDSPHACGKFHVIPSSEWRLIAYPWLQRYSQDLPTSGEFFFVPPVQWTNAQLHGPQHGFLDIDGNEWCWDMLHQNHWDVQLRQGGYRNVSTDGRIL
jgi:hypothetical protein